MKIFVICLCTLLLQKLCVCLRKAKVRFSSKKTMTTKINFIVCSDQSHTKIFLSFSIFKRIFIFDTHYTVPVRIFANSFDTRVSFISPIYLTDTSKTIPTPVQVKKCIGPIEFFL